MRWERKGFDAGAEERQKQIPEGNDRKKSKGKGRNRSRSSACGEG
jgi:hypothetical protein